MIETYIRPAYQKYLVDPLITIIAERTALQPIQLSAAAMISGVVSALFLIINLPVIAVLFLVLSGYLDTVDGSLARYQQRHTAQGAVLDIVGDRVVEFAVIYGLYCVAPQIRGAASLWMLGATLLCITSFLVVGIFSKNNSHKSFHYSQGLIERAEAFVFFIAMMLIPAWFLWLAWIYVVLVIFTASFRVYEFYRFEESQCNH